MNWLDLIIKLFPMVLQVVVAIETALPSQSGAAKKAVAMAVMAPAVAQANPPVGSGVPVVALDINAMVDHTVAALNQAGVFQAPAAPAKVA